MMDKKLLAHALGIWAFTADWPLEDRIVEAEVIISHMMIDCEHRWAVWMGKESRTITAGEVFCGKCGIGKEVKP